MQNCWNSDNRDLVKWAALTHLARAFAGATSFCEGLRLGDGLMLYPHRQRNARWFERTRTQFAASRRSAARAVLTLTCPEVASDVASFALRKPRVNINTRHYDK